MGSADPEPTGSFRAGFSALAGLPNVGKSTLLNRLVGERLSIVTPKAQTTRQRLLGIYTDESHQAVFVDTPGLLEPRYRLQELMREQAEAAMEDADLLVYVADAGYPRSVEHATEVAATLVKAHRARAGDLPHILCLNKVDRVTQDERGDLEAVLTEAGWATVVATVATEGKGVERLKSEVLARLPLSPPLYPAEDLSVAPVRFFVSEIIRETAFEQLAEEVPYATAVTVEEYREPSKEGGPVYIEAWIYVERESQKGIVIGSSGQMIRRIGTESRRKVERFLDGPVYLDLRVKVLRNWRKRESALKLLGFRKPG